MTNEALVKTENPNNSLVEAAANEVTTQEKLFALAQRKAMVYSQSSLVPKEYQNNIGNVLIAENMARRMGADTLMVMQNLYVVHGKPGWSAQFLVACFNSCGRFSAIKYKFSGEPKTDGYGCVAFCTELSTGEVIEGTKITWAMANAEGWVNKAGSKWKTMPEQMFRYRAATFLIRSTAPEIGMGLLTKDEIEDISPNGNGTNSLAAGVGALKQRLTNVIAEGAEANSSENADESVVDLKTIPEIAEIVAPVKKTTKTKDAAESEQSVESKMEDLLTAINEKIAETTGGDEAEVKKLLGGRLPNQMDLRQLEELWKELNA